MTIWFSSDLHFSHINILEYSKRPFADVHEMNESIVKNWNQLVQPDDIAYLIGDICMGNLDQSIPYVKRLNGRKFLIEGNHDKQALKRADFVSNFEAVHKYFELKDHGDLFVLCHFPIASWNKMHSGGLMLHGHSHHSYHPGLPSTTDQGKILDVGIDGRGYNYCPISIDRVRKIMATKQFIKQDHHGAEM